MSSFCCPICRKRLDQQEHFYQCCNNHHFDRAKSGYVNLLLANNKHTKLPGDNKQMVAARCDFLKEGYYESLCRTLCEAVRANINLQKDSLTILDAGCGEGYYTTHLADALQGTSAEIFGVDISKFALDKAAKKNASIAYAAASVFHLPMKDGSCDVLLNLFSPYCGAEFLRVLKMDGLMVCVIPGEKHLWEMKKVLYEEPYQNEINEEIPEGFYLLQNIHIKESIRLRSGRDIENLFTMTPYYYRTPEQGTDKLLQLETLPITIEFEIRLYRRR